MALVMRPPEDFWLSFCCFSAATFAASLAAFSTSFKVFFLAFSWSWVKNESIAAAFPNGRDIEMNK
jgi:hypothetical protein